ncbi:MAG: spermidine/putrescine ABC transporter substrate-binding protein [Blautia sp.]|nr:spermidine/putrescine ABC transporter substrate-binding protein [Eubacteriales bacterium]MED9965326.1 spermidine/putrescine ABC transporter substrate-binding protein [Blautia sp.]
MKMKRAAAVLMCAALAGSVLTGFRDAGEDKELVLFTWQGMFPQEVLDGFEEETGVKVIYSNFDTDETMLEKLSMAKGGDYDFVIADDYILETVIANGLAQELDKESLENIGNINPLYQGQFYDPEDAYTVPYGAGIPLIVYDPEQVELDIKGYSDLWDESLEDSIALVGNYRVINGITQLSLGKSMNEEDVDVIKETGKKLQELAPNVRMIQDDNTQNALLNGEASVALLYTSQVTAALAENPDLKVVYPEEGLGFGIMGAFIPSQAPNKDAAYSFLDYLMQPEIAAQCTNYIGYYSTNKAADEFVNENLVVPDDVTKGEIVQNVSQEAEEQYNKNWTEFKAACD